MPDIQASFEKTHQRYHTALDDALSHFRSLLSSANSNKWKPIQPAPPSPATPLLPFDDGLKGKARDTLNGIGSVDFATVQVHKRSAKGADVVRAVAEVVVDPDRFDLDDFKGVLQTPEIRASWDRLVHQAGVVEVLDPQTRIAKTDFCLGWPANPRDTVTISKTFSNPTTVIDIATSLPRAADDPAYLRPSPPSVRANVILLAWCVQLSPSTPSPAATGSDASPSSSPNTSSLLSPQVTSQLSKNEVKARITVFWQVNWKGAIFSTHHAQIASLLAGFVDYVRTQADRIPLVAGYGQGIQFDSKQYNSEAETLTVEYSVVDDDDEVVDDSIKTQWFQDQQRVEERAVELRLPLNQGWDVQVDVQGHGQGVDEAWAAAAERTLQSSRIVLRFNHAGLASVDHLVRVKVQVQRLAGGKTLRVNGNQMAIVVVEARDQSSSTMDIFTDQASGSGLSVQTLDPVVAASPMTTASSVTVAAPAPSAQGSPVVGLAPPVQLESKPKTRQVASQATRMAPLLRRSYIYFTSLLQEPEAKWRHVSDSRGVTVTQLKSIDPTVTIFRAEATFVGIGVWDVFSALSTAGARTIWDNGVSDVTLLEDLNELSSLWQIKSKSTWPTVCRDSILIRTAYKSPTSIHLFSFSTDDTTLFSNIPIPDTGTIRTQTDLSGWSIEALSPTTVQITIIDQTDQKGWTPKSWTPARLVNQVAGLGDFALKCGGPPTITRLLRAKVMVSRYEHEKNLFRTEYHVTSQDTEQLSLAMPMTSSTCTPSDVGLVIIKSHHDVEDIVECEIRCDVETWSPGGLELVIDPPPMNVSLCSRHRLSSGGGGCWITIEHDVRNVSGSGGVVVGEKIRVVVKKSLRDNGGRERGSVYVNGSKVEVEVEELPEDEIQLLSKRRRVKAMPIPLDQYPVTGPQLWKRGGGSGLYSANSKTSNSSPLQVEYPTKPSTPLTSSKPTFQAFPTTPIAMSPKPATTTVPTTPRSTKCLLPLEYGLEALAKLQTFQIEHGPDSMIPPPGWQHVADKESATVYKKLVSSVSETFPVYRVDKVIEGVTSEELTSILSSTCLRPTWDDRIERCQVLESYGFGCQTLLLTMKPALLFKGRFLQVVTVSAQHQVPSVSATSSTATIHFIATTSFPSPQSPGGWPFVMEKCNPEGFVEAKLLLEGWIMQTLDPYSSSSHPIPSTRCTYFSSIEYGGSVPAAFNSMLDTSLPVYMTSLEQLVKGKGPFPRLCRPQPCLSIEGPLSHDGMSDWQWKLKVSQHRSLVISVDVSKTELDEFQVQFYVPSNIFTSTMNNSSSEKHEIPNSVVGRHEISRGKSGDAASTLRHLSSQPDLRSKSSTGTLKRSMLVVANNIRVSEGQSPAVGESVQDLVIGEVIVDRKWCTEGYDIKISTRFGTRQLDTLEEDEGGKTKRKLPKFSLSSNSVVESTSIPVKVTVHDIASPSIFAASLDSGSKRHHQLVRLILPPPLNQTTSPRLEELFKDPKTSTDETTAKAEKPKWFNELQQRSALLSVTITAKKSKESGQGSGVSVNGQSVDVMGIKESQLVLDRREEDEYRVASSSISRVTKRSSKGEGTSFASNECALPTQLRHALAIATELTANDVSDVQSPKVLSKSTTPTLLSPTTEVAEGSNSQTPLQITFPSVNTRSRTGSMTPLSQVLGSFPIQSIGSVTSSALTPTYTFRHLVMTALIFFLLGSLIRSLYSPTDYFIIPDQASHSEVKLLNALSDRRQWKEVRKLVDLSWIPGVGNWGLVIAVIRRNSLRLVS